MRRLWFKVDDSFSQHRKAMLAGDEALGLWVLAESWCARMLTDGFVPDYVAASLAPRRLVSAGLWRPGEKDDEKGWLEHHSPHAAPGMTQRSVRPIGSSLWLRWPEFGMGIRPRPDTRGGGPRGPALATTNPPRPSGALPWVITPDY
nr:MAG TPA: replisome organizer [Caudoviricetes sp.]